VSRFHDERKVRKHEHLYAEAFPSETKLRPTTGRHATYRRCHDIVKDEPIHNKRYDNKDRELDGTPRKEFLVMRLRDRVSEKLYGLITCLKKLFSTVLT